MSMSQMHGWIENGVVNVELFACDDYGTETYCDTKTFSKQELMQDAEKRRELLSIVSMNCSGLGPHNHYEDTSAEFDDVVESIREVEEVDSIIDELETM